MKYPSSIFVKSRVVLVLTSTVFHCVICNPIKLASILNLSTTKLQKISIFPLVLILLPFFQKKCTS